MDIHTATEQAYKNGYKAGMKDFAEKLKKQGIPITVGKGHSRVYVMCSNIHIDNLLEELTGNEKERLTMSDDYHFEVGV